MKFTGPQAWFYWSSGTVPVTGPEDWGRLVGSWTRCHTGLGPALTGPGARFHQLPEPEIPVLGARFIPGPRPGDSNHRAIYRATVELLLPSQSLGISSSSLVRTEQLFSFLLSGRASRHHTPESSRSD